MRAENARLQERLRLENRELQYEIEVIQVENVKLKDIVRELSEPSGTEDENEVDLGISTTTGSDKCATKCDSDTATGPIEHNNNIETNTAGSKSKSTINSGIVLAV